MKYIISLVAIAITGWLSAQHNIVLFYSVNGVQHTDTVLYSTTQTHFDDVYIQPGSTFSIDSVVVNTEITQRVPDQYLKFGRKNGANIYVIFDIEDLVTDVEDIYDLKIMLLNQNNREYFFLLTITETASVNELSKNDLNLYPNPVKDVLHLNGPAEIYTPEGKLILTSNESEIDIRMLNSGIYLVKNGYSVIRIVKD